MQAKQVKHEQGYKCEQAKEAKLRMSKPSKLSMSKLSMSKLSMHEYAKRRKLRMCKLSTLAS